MYVSVTEYGVQSYPIDEMVGWRFMRIEYWEDDAPHSFLEHHVWMPPKIGSCELEDIIKKALGCE